jgi:phage tail-like protein
MPNMEHDVHPLMTNYKLTLEGFKDSYFESVRGLGYTIEDVSSHEKKNQKVNSPGRFDANDIYLTRRLGVDKDYSNWSKECKQGKLNRKSGSVIIMDSEENEVVRFNFFDAWPKAYSISELTKETTGNSMLLEEIVLSVSDMEQA